MSGIVEFLTARLDEDERIARLGPRTQVAGSWSVEEFQPSEPGAVPIATWVVDDQQMGVGQVNGDFVAAHIARHDPAHVLAEVKAKRAIVAEHAIVHRNIGWLEDGEEAGGEIPVCGRCVRRHSHYLSRAEVPEGGCRTVRYLAAPYADHPDYDPTWGVASG